MSFLSKLLQRYSLLKIMNSNKEAEKVNQARVSKNKL